MYNFTPTICIAQLLAALQVLMTLVMPLTTTTTMALPVTSKPIESTAENLAWQAWIMLPPEQKQLMKSRKVTPKSIFTLPLRVECPEGHRQVDTKCIPTVIGSNAILIDPSVLGLVLGSNPIDIEYDYEDEDGDKEENAAYNPPLYLSNPLGTDKSNDETVLELRPPTKDEPLKFNIFQSKFPTDDYPLEDYSGVSNEGTVTVVEKDQANTSNINFTFSESFDATVNVTTEKDLISEASNVSKLHTLSTLSDSSDFNLDDLDALSLPASSSQEQKSQKVSLFKEDTSIHFVTAVMDTESTTGDKDLRTQQAAENDLETLLQTESLMPMLNHTTVTTVMPAESLTLTTASLPDENTSSLSDELTLNVEDEEMTTILPHLMDRGDMDAMEKQDKAEFIRSATINSLYEASDEGDNEAVTTLTPSTSNDEPSETEETTATTIIQLDDTTIIENNDDSTTTTELSSSSSAAAATTATIPLAEPLQELLLRQEQALKDFQELQRMRKGEKDQHTVLKKSKVEPVEVLSASATTVAAAKTMPSEATAMAATASPAAAATTTKLYELTTAETVTPLLTVHNNEHDKNDRDNNNNNNNIENNNNINDRFYYQHFAKQDLESAAVSGATTSSQQHKSPKATTQTAAATTATTTWSSLDTETSASPATAAASTSEIDLTEELRLINELVKGKRPATTSSATTTTTSAADSSSTTDDGSSTSTTPSPSPSPSESSASSIKSTLETAQIWSKIMPLIKTTPKTSTLTTTKALTQQSESSTDSSTTGETSEMPSTTPVILLVSNRSHRNSKIIRIHGLNAFNSITNTPSPQTTTTEDISTTLTAEEEESASSVAPSADDAYEPFWWLPVAWRLDKSTTTTTKPEQETSSEEMPVLFRFWSTYHAPKSS